MIEKITVVCSTSENVKSKYILSLFLPLSHACTYNTFNIRIFIKFDFEKFLFILQYKF